MSVKGRALHFVLKIGNLKKNVEFFRDLLGMKVLRHEVFDKGCEAACNGPYSTKWSKTMIGYGPEDRFFVLELTYNYSVGSYQLGNDYQYIRLSVGKLLFDKLKSKTTEEQDIVSLKSPDGYQFIVGRNKDDTKNEIIEVCLSCKDINRSIQYWNGLLNMDKVNSTEGDQEACFIYRDSPASLRLNQISQDIDHKSAYGRIAFSCPSKQLKLIEKSADDTGNKVLTRLLSLDTPGKATVQVVILADPDGHEICFVGDEGFRELSQTDLDANKLIEQSIADDKSDEWFASKSLSKKEI